MDAGRFLTPHYTLEEFNLDDRALAEAGVADPVEVQRMRGSARILCLEILEPARAQFGPQVITSAWRPPARNAGAGGKATSFHLYQGGRCAADHRPVVFERIAAQFDWMRLQSGLGFDKLILEFPGAMGSDALQRVATQLNGATPSTAAAIAAAGAWQPRVIHTQLDIDAAPRRQALIGFTGAGALYIPVPVAGRAGSHGDYRGTVAASVNPPAGSDYKLHINSTTSGVSFARDATVKAREE